jgi:F-type H+-transporting ATPase subunit epsilon
VSDPLTIDIVAADRMVWSGEARIVLTRTTDGDIGILANHTPVLSVLVPGIVEVRTPDGGYLVFAVDKGFISVAQNHVSILAEYAQDAGDINVDEARSDLEKAQAATGDDVDPAVVDRAEARVRAAEKAR